MQVANKRNLDVFTPGLVHSLQSEPDPEDIRFRYSFLLPSLEYSRFRTDRPIAKLVTRCNEIIAENNETVEMFRGSCIGLHIYELFQSMTTVMYASIFFVPIIQQQRFVYLRDVFLRRDGTCLVCLFKLEYIDDDPNFNRNDGLFFQVQEQTELFPLLTSSVPLLL